MTYTSYVMYPGRVTSRDMTRPNWKRTVQKCLRLAELLRGHGATVTFPPDFETPPDQRKSVL